MRRAERLFRLIELLRGRRLAMTAEALGTALEVSPRTVYRDIAALQATGTPIEGEAGVGYRLDPRYHLPPLMFDNEEVQALLAGLRLAASLTDDALGDAAKRAETKVRAVLDEAGRARADRSPYLTPVLAEEAPIRALHLTVRKACEAREKLRLTYEDEMGRQSSRVVWPIALMRWRAVWTLYAWCELRTDFRSFRIDRIAAADTGVGSFPHHPERSIAGMMHRFGVTEGG
ncbi:MAG: YafY family protein [Pseudomonadota bacterium]